MFLENNIVHFFVFTLINNKIQASLKKTVFYLKTKLFTKHITHYVVCLNYGRCEKLFVVNEALRDQLREAHENNEALTNDLQKLTTDWEQMREELLSKEEEWKEEEQVSNHCQLCMYVQECKTVHLHIATKR